MQRACVQWGGAAAAAVLALLMGAPLRAADDSGVRPVAEELGQRTKPEAAPDGAQKGGLSDSAVRVLMTYAFSIIPEEQPGPDGKPLKVDKSDANKFLIPDDDARRVIRAATRSAYAEACELADLAATNYQTLIKSEAAKKIWSEQQLLMINALHIFSASYFSGNVKITEGPEEGAAPADTTTVSKGDAPAQGADQAAAGTEIVVPKRPQCPPEQKQKVMNAINAFVQAAQAPSPQAAPAAPASSGSN
ncbi:MAG: hypothetical protein H7X74_04530 [Methyloceanibacter sp.]|nr:hypothetical protein [Methyloceanibacter sp.]